MSHRVLTWAVAVVLVCVAATGCKRKNKNRGSSATAAASATPAGEVVRIEKLAEMKLHGDTPSMAWSPDSTRVAVSAAWVNPPDEVFDEEGELKDRDELGLHIVDAYAKSTRHAYHKEARHPVWMSEQTVAFLPELGEESGVLTLDLQKGKVSHVLDQPVENILMASTHSVYAYVFDTMDFWRLDHDHDQCAKEVEYYDGPGADYEDYGYEPGPDDEGYEDYEGYEGHEGDAHESEGPWFEVRDGALLPLSWDSDSPWETTIHNPQCAPEVIVDGTKTIVAESKKGAVITRGKQQVKLAYTPMEDEESKLRVEGCLASDGRYFAAVTRKGGSFKLLVYDLTPLYPSLSASPTEGDTPATDAPKKAKIDSPWTVQLVGDTPSMAWNPDEPNLLVINSASIYSGPPASAAEREKLGAYVVDAKAQQTKQIFSGQVYHPVWSAGDVAWVSDDGLFVLDPSEERPRWLIPHDLIYSLQPTLRHGLVVYAPYTDDVVVYDDYYEEIEHPAGWMEVWLTEKPHFVYTTYDFDGMGPGGVPSQFGYRQCRQLVNGAQIVYQPDGIKVSVDGQFHRVTDAPTARIAPDYWDCDALAEGEDEVDPAYDDEPGPQLRYESWGVCGAAACLSPDGRLIATVTGKPGNLIVRVHSIYGRATGDTSSPRILGP